MLVRKAQRWLQSSMSMLTDSSSTEISQDDKNNLIIFDDVPVDKNKRNESYETFGTNELEYESDKENIAAEVGNKCEESAEEIESIIGPNEDGGHIWRAHVLPNDFDADGTVCFLKPRDYDPKKKAIKPCQGIFPITEKDLFSSLVCIAGKKSSAEAASNSGMKS
eukprot:13946031-Ditylum_brightwellii.AAC.1